MSDHLALRQAAEAATSGPWMTRHDDYFRSGFDYWLMLGDARDTDIPLSTGLNAPNAAFIAAANPTTVLALLDEIEALRGALEPFAEAIKDNYSHQMDSAPIVAGLHGNDLRLALTLGDFRRARALTPDTAARKEKL